MKTILDYKDFLNEKYIENPEYRIKIFFDRLEKKINIWFTKGSLFSSGAELIDINRSTLNADSQNLLFNFIDQDFYYQVYVILSIQDVSETSLDECYVKVKKYDKDGNLLDELGKDMTVNELDENAIIQLYSELNDNLNKIENSEIETPKNIIDDNKKSKNDVDF